MTNGYRQSTNEAYEEYKGLTPDQREYQQFAKLHEMYSRMLEMDHRFAAKWVETSVKIFIGMIVFAFFSVVIKMVMGPTAEIIALLGL